MGVDGINYFGTGPPAARCQIGMRNWTELSRGMPTRVSKNTQTGFMDYDGDRNHWK